MCQNVCLSALFLSLSISFYLFLSLSLSLDALFISGEEQEAAAKVLITKTD